MSGAPRIGLVGGTFDPVHYGHLDAADAARTHLGLNEVVFMPSRIPPHRHVGPRVTGLHRFAMLALAVQGHPGYRLSDAELQRDGPSYTIDTLRRLHGEGLTAVQLFFILGADAFAEIATWREFPAVLDAANFVVIARPGAHLQNAVARTPALSSRVRNAAAGNIEDGTGVFLVEARTRDVSSTVIRTRLASGLPIDDLVPVAVAQHIAANHLYGAVNELHG